MEALFLKVVNMSITASYVILVVLAVRLLLRRIPKRYSYLLWFAALFRLVCPVSFSAVFSMFQMKPFDMRFAQRGGAALDYIPENIGLMPSPQMSVGVPAMNSVIAECLPSAHFAASVNPLQVWIFAAMVLWCAGVAALFAYNLITYVRLRRRIASAVQVQDIVFEAGGIRSPFILGFFNPRIFIPFGLREPERDYVLRHERCHLGKKDHWVKFVWVCVLAVHWFNPLVWIAFSQMSKDMEMRCDEQVLSESGGGIAKAYSLSLLSCAQHRPMAGAAPLAFGETGVRARIKNILRFKQPARWVRAVSALLCVSALAACAANPLHKDDANRALFGEYVVDDTIYSNPLSSRIIPSGTRFQLAGNSLRVEFWDNSTQDFSMTYQKILIDKQEFENALTTSIPRETPLLDGYSQCYQLAESPDSGYRLYQMDDELWLSQNRWIIFRILKAVGAGIEASVVGTQDGVADFLSLQGDYNSYYEGDTCYNITPESIRQSTEYRIFKYDQSCEAFLFYENRVIPLGTGFGGFGVTGMETADMNRDGLKELYFTYSYGSGVYRSRAAYFDPVLTQVVDFDYARYHYDAMMFAKDAKDNLSLYAAEIFDSKGFVTYKMKSLHLLLTVSYENNDIKLKYTTAAQ